MAGPASAVGCATAAITAAHAAPTPPAWRGPPVRRVAQQHGGGGAGSLGSRARCRQTRRPGRAQVRPRSAPRTRQRFGQRREAVVEEQFDVLGRRPAQLGHVHNRHPAHVVQHQRAALHPGQPLHRRHDDGVRGVGAGVAELVRSGELADRRLYGVGRQAGAVLSRSAATSTAVQRARTSRSARLPQRRPRAPHPRQRRLGGGAGDPGISGDGQGLCGELGVRRSVERRELAKPAAPSHPNPRMVAYGELPLCHVARDE